MVNNASPILRQLAGEQICATGLHDAAEDVGCGHSPDMVRTMDGAFEGLWKEGLS